MRRQVELLSSMTTWTRIEAQSYAEALELLEELAHHHTAIVQEGEHRWSVYISGEASALPRLVFRARRD